MIKKGDRLASERDFSSRVASLDLLDASLRHSIAGHLQDEEQILQIIHVPPFRAPEITKGAWASFNHLRPGRPSPETILVCTPQRLLVAALPAKEGAPFISTIRISDILSMEFGTILLLGWLAFNRVEQGSLECTRIFFNTVGEPIFTELVEHIRRIRIAQANLPAWEGQRNLSVIERLPFKFKNIITNRLLLPDEAIQEVVFRPAVWRRRFVLFRQMLAPNLALLRTNYHILVMHEQENSSDKYGVIFRYCPLSALKRARVEHTPEAVRLELVLVQDGATETLDFSFPLEEEAQIRADFSGWLPA